MDYVISAGDSLTEAAKKMVNLANKNNKEIVSNFNQTEIIARPGDSPDFVADRWREDFRQKCEKHRKNQKEQIDLCESEKIAQATISNLEDFAKSSPDKNLATFVGDAAAWIKKQSEKRKKE